MSPHQGVAVSELCAALGISGAAANVVNVIRSVGEGGAAPVTRAWASEHFSFAEIELMSRRKFIDNANQNFKRIG